MLKRTAVWGVCLAPLGASAVVLSLFPDPWRWGTVAAVSFALTCEVWHGYCQHGGSIVEGQRNRGVRYMDETFPILERLFTRDVVVRQSTGGAGLDAFSEVRAVPRFGAKSVEHSPLVRAAGRLTLAAFVVAGFAARQFEIPWFTPS